MVKHRRPPKPSSWDVARGTCRFCGTDIIENDKINRRKHWHEACARKWKIMNDPSTARDHVMHRDKKACRECGAKGKDVKFEVDHIRPLFEANGDLSYWMADNLILLCRACHVAKTRTDMVRYRERLLSSTVLTKAETPCRTGSVGCQEDSRCQRPT